MLTSLTAVASALALSFRYQTALHITTKECIRYWSKSVNLALCYRGFAPNKKSDAAREAGRAAFFCCAYDVITDWRHYDESAFNCFMKILKSEVPDALTQIASRLFAQECEMELRLDGLSRGIDALEFVSGLIGCREYIRQHYNFRDLGIIMQIVDDVLDYEDDRHNGDVNCLLVSPSQRVKHLQVLSAFDVQRFKSVFPHSAVLCFVVRSAQQKADQLLSIASTVSEELPTIDCGPYQNIADEKPTKIARYVGD